MECARAEDWESFEAFRSAVLAATITVEERPADCAFCASGPGFPTYDVGYDSPSQGLIQFGWSLPLTVAGEEIPISDYPRIHNPWVYAERGAPAWLVQSEGAGLHLDWERGERSAWRVFGPDS